MSSMGSPIKKLQRQLNGKSYLLLCVPLVLVVIVIMGLDFYHIPDDTFQNFSYPSEENFYDILYSQLNNTYTVLNPYRPQLVNNISFTNNNDVNVVIVVKSSIPNRIKRDNIRQTWGSKLCRKSHRFHIYFALGQSIEAQQNCTVEEERKSIAEESQKHEDILRFNFLDTYGNNTYKVMAIMDYFVNFYGNIPYLLIVDDDFFVDPAMLTETITNQISKYEFHHYFGGHVWFHSMPQRSRLSKWHVTIEDYKYDFYPPYTSGGFMLISNPMVKTCDKLLPYLKYSSVDDVLLGILLFKLNIYPNHLKNVLTYKTNKLPTDLLAYHGISDELLDFWKQRENLRMC